MSQRLRRSRFISLFSQREEIYLHHDLTGDILRIDEKLLGFLDWLDTPHTRLDASLVFKDRFTETNLDAFFDILPAHRILVPESIDEPSSFEEWFPFRGPWLLTY